MSQLKPSFVREIKLMLANSKYSENDFSIELPSSGKVLVKVVFKYKPDYCLRLVEERRKESVTIKEQLSMSSRVQNFEEVVYSVHCVPGRYKTVAIKDLGGLGQFLGEIEEWCDSIREDLYALAPERDPLKKWRDQFEQQFSNVGEGVDEYFTDDELSKVDNGLDELYEKIEALREKCNMTAAQLEELKREMREFKGSARAYTKGMWFKIFGGRFLKFGANILKSEEGRSFLADGARMLLGMDPKK